MRQCCSPEDLYIRLTGEALCEACGVVDKLAQMLEQQVKGRTPTIKEHDAVLEELDGLMPVRYLFTRNDDFPALSLAGLAVAPEACFICLPKVVSSSRFFVWIKWRMKLLDREVVYCMYFVSY